MALIKCPECKKEISDKAASCPSCGCPIAANSNENNNQTPENKVQTIEKTSKKYKGQQLMAMLLGVIGFFMLFEEEARTVGGIICIIALIWYAIVGMGIWWEHD